MDFENIHHLRAATKQIRSDYLKGAIGSSISSQQAATTRDVPVKSPIWVSKFENVHLETTTPEICFSNSLARQMTKKFIMIVQSPSPFTSSGRATAKMLAKTRLSQRFYQKRKSSRG
jgi:hypothetical protein